MSENRLCLRPYDENLTKNIVKTKYEHLIREKFGKYVFLDFHRIYIWNDTFPATPRLRAVGC
jgi:hypothetical protein